MSPSSKKSTNNILFLYGENSFLLDQKLSEIKSQFTKKNNDLNICTFPREKTPNFQNFKTEVETSPFLSEKKLIIVKNAFSDLNAEYKKKLADFLDKIPEQVILVITENGLPDRRTSLYKKLIKEKNEEFKQLNPLELSSWIIEQAKLYKGIITPEAVSVLEEFCDNNLTQLDQEVHKLCLYKDGEEIQPEDVRKLVTPKRESKIFDLIDAIGEKNKTKTINELNKLFDAGENEFYILSMLNYQLRNLTLVLDLKTREDKLNSFTIARELGIHPFVAQKTLVQADNFTLDTIRKLYQKLVRLEYTLKTSDEDSKLEVTRFILATMR